MGRLQAFFVFLSVSAFPLSVRAQAAGMVYDQQQAGDRLVVMEAESARENVAANGDTWTLATTATAPAAAAGYVGSGAMVCVPNDGGGNTNATGFVNGPRLLFRALFRVTGTHYVWVRGRALDDTAATPSQPVGNNDSCHVALDGVAAAEGFQMSGWSGTEWKWSRTRLNGNASFSVTTTGVHTVGIYMREDGFLVDRILITTNAAYAPNPLTAAGPAASPQISDLIATVPVLSGTAGPMIHNLSWTTSAGAAGYTLQRAPATGEAWQALITQPGTTYADHALIQGETYRYRVFANQPSINFSAGPSNVVTLTPGAPPPRVEEGNTEGLIDDKCSCGSTIPAPGAAAPLLAALLLTAVRRRSGGRRTA